MLMLLAFPMNVWRLAAERQIQTRFVVLWAVVLLTLWAQVAVARRHRIGRLLAGALGAYAVIMLVFRARELAGVPRAALEPLALASLAFGGSFLVALLVAAVACLPLRTRPGAERSAPAVLRSLQLTKALWNAASPRLMIGLRS